MKYFKLGPKALSFNDTQTGKRVLTGEVVGFTKQELKSERTQEAILGGHIVQVEHHEEVEVEEVDAPEHIDTEDADLDEEDDNTDVDKLTKEQITEMITAEYELSDDELKNIKKMRIAELREYYKALTDEGEEE